jgi:hypothetical protein
MATTRRGKKRTAGKGSKAARAKGPAARGGRSGAGARSVKRGARTGAAKAGKAGAARARQATRAVRKAGATLRGAAQAAGGAATAALAKLKARFDRERGALEKRLTETVREIGQLRHHEMRATQLERQLAERDETIAALRREIEALRSRPAAVPVGGAAADQPRLDFGSEEIRIDDLDESAPLDDEDDDDLM